MYYRHRNSLRALAKQQFIYGRGSVHIFVRYRRFTRVVRDARFSAWQLLDVLGGVINIARGRRRRGRWIGYASFAAGQVLESFRLRDWYLG